MISPSPHQSSRDSTVRTRIVAAAAILVAAWATVGNLEAAPQRFGRGAAQGVAYRSEAYPGRVEQRAARAVEKALIAVLAGRIEDGVSDLQTLLEEGENAQSIVLHPKHNDPKSHQVFYPVENRVRDALRILSKPAQAYYRDRYDPVAQATLLEAWKSTAGGDAGLRERLRRVWRRYPITEAGAVAALRLAELLRESGRPNDGQRLLLEVRLELDRGRLPSTPELTQLVSHLSRGSWGIGPGTDAPPRLPDSDLQWELTWVADTIARDSKSRRSSQDPDGDVAYTSRPLEQFGRITIASFRGLTTLDVDAPQPSKNRPSKRRSKNPRSQDTSPRRRPINTLHYTARRYPYREVSPNLELAPQREGDWIVTTVVESATRHEGGMRRSSVQKVSIPRRGLRVLREAGNSRRVIWRSVDSEDPNVALTSFNGGILIRGPWLYALGWKDSGLIDASLICFELETGKVAWKSILVSNQVELTRFGFMASEPFLGKIVAHEGTIFASTNLGAVAAIDADTGRRQWVTTYLPVREPRNMFYRRRHMNFPYHPTTWWEHSPLVVLGDRVYVAPQDSNRLLAVSRLTGAIERRLVVKGVGHRLLGVDNDRVVIANTTEIRLLDRDLAPAGSVIRFSDNVIGAPLLTLEGVVYLAATGLRLVQLGRPPVPSILYPADGSERGLWAGTPVLSIADGSIYAVTPYRVLRFQPRSE